MSDIVYQFSRNLPTNPLNTLTQGASNIANIVAQTQQQKAIAQKNAEIQAMYDKIKSGTATSQDYLSLAAILPEDQSKPIREAFQLMTEDQQRGMLNDSGKIFSAFRSGQPSIAVNMLRDQALAYENSGKANAAKLYREWADIAESGPEGAKQAENYFGFTIAQMPGGTDVVDNANNIFEESRKAESHIIELQQLGADLGLTKEQINETIAKTGKLNAEIAKIFFDMQAAGEMSPEELVNQESKIRAEYQKRVGNYTAAVSDYERLKASAGDPTGAGDVALITSFMKMLDPGSVVRETEFATAQDTAGLYGRLQTIFERLKGGQRLTEEQRNNFLGLAGKYMQAAEKQENNVREDLGTVVKDFGLSYDRVFGTSIQGGRDYIKNLRSSVNELLPEGFNVNALSEAEIQQQYPTLYTQAVASIANPEQIRLNFIQYLKNTLGEDKAQGLENVSMEILKKNNPGSYQRFISEYGNNVTVTEVDY